MKMWTPTVSYKTISQKYHNALSTGLCMQLFSAAPAIIGLSTSRPSAAIAGNQTWAGKMSNVLSSSPSVSKFATFTHSLPIYYNTLSSGERLLMLKCKQNIPQPLSIWG